VDNQLNNDEYFMDEALKLARQAAAIGEVPIGAVVVKDGQIIGRGYNRREIDNDPLAHAELLAVHEASKHLGAWRLIGCTLYVTLEPCVMCAGALVNARIDRLVFGAKDPKAGAVSSLMNVCSDPRLNHRVKNIEGGVRGVEASALLSQFFKALR
jgi:tRNA(adenine34) deaminase